MPRTGDVTAIGFPSNLVRYLVNFRSPEDPNPTLEVGEKLFWIKIHSTSGSTVHLTTIFRDIIQTTQEGAFTFQLSLNPVTTEKVDELSVRVILPSDAIISDSSPTFLKAGEQGNTLSGVSKDIDTSSETPEGLTVTFNSRDLRLLDISYAEMTVEYPTRVIDFLMKLRSGGGRPLSSVRLMIPPGSEVIETKDELGKIGNSYDKDSGGLTVNFRRSLNQGEYETIQARFKIPEDSTLIEESDGVLRIYLLLPMNLTVRVYDLTVNLRAAELLSSTPEPENLQKIYPESLQLSYTFDHIDPFNAEETYVQLDYKPLPSRFSILPYLWGGVLAAIALGAVVSIYARRRAGVVSEEEKPLLELVDEADELSAACQRIADLISTRKILDKGYVRPRILELRSSVRRYTGRIASLAGELRKSKPELGEHLESLAEAAKRIESDVESLWLATHSYLTGSMGRSSFRKIAEEHYKRIREAHKKLSNELEYLRGKLS